MTILAVTTDTTVTVPLALPLHPPKGFFHVTVEHLPIMQTVVTTEWVAEHLNDEDIVVAHLAWVHQDSAAAYADYLCGPCARSYIH